MRAKAVLTCMGGISSKTNYFQEDFTLKVDYLVTTVNLTIKPTNTSHRSLSSFTGLPLKMLFREIQIHLVNLKFQILNLNNLFSEWIHRRQNRIDFVKKSFIWEIPFRENELAKVPEKRFSEV